MKNEVNTNSIIENTSNKKPFFLRSIWVKWLKKFLKYLSIFFIIVFGITWLLFYVIPFAQELSFLFLPETHKEFIAADNKTSDKFKDKVIKNTLKIQRKLDSNFPRAAYIIINTTENKFYLYSGKRLIRKGMCSTGSYTLLQGSENQQWIFKTPRGSMRIHGKTTSPVWKKPDWAFIEEGLPVPPANDNSRFEYGTLGDYALSLGDGYLIHGTLYKRFLGLPVTHGCIRLNDEDLESVYNTLTVGSKVFIY